MAIERINGGQILRDVRVAMDLNPKTTPLTDVGDIGTLALKDIITSKILDAIVAVESAAPLQLLDVGTVFTGQTVNWDSDITGAGWVILPDNFLRLIAYKMSDWKRAVTTPIAENDDLYLAQRSGIAGIMGSPEKPVCAIVQRSNGTLLEFYTSNTTATIAQAVYRPYPTIDEEGGVDISKRCYRAVIYYIAGLVYQTYAEKDQAAVMFELSKAELNNVR